MRDAPAPPRPALLVEVCSGCCWCTWHRDGGKTLPGRQTRVSVSLLSLLNTSSVLTRQCTWQSNWKQHFRVRFPSKAPPHKENRRHPVVQSGMNVAVTGCSRFSSRPSTSLLLSSLIQQHVQLLSDSSLIPSWRSTKLSPDFSPSPASTPSGASAISPPDYYCCFE